MEKQAFELLATEVFMAPSVKVVENRFESSTKIAGCNGKKCKSGHCQIFSGETNYPAEFYAL